MPVWARQYTRAASFVQPPMPQIVQRTVLFADLRGSTSLFETLGNAEATAVVTQTVALVRHAVQRAEGRTVKTLGDGLMAVFSDPAQAFEAAVLMHAELDLLLSQGRVRAEQASGPRALRLQVAVSLGEVVEMSGDCFGDAVNVAARLLDHAGDNETLFTSEARDALPNAIKARFRNLDGINVRGRVEPVRVYVLERPAGSDAVATQFGAPSFAPSEPDGIRLTWLDLDRMFDTRLLPIVLGRSVQAAFCITDGRVSRQHARIDWDGGRFNLTDLSFNGSYVRFSGNTEVMALRRTSCPLHGSGVIGLGSSPAQLETPVVRFEVLHFAETQAQD